MEILSYRIEYSLPLGLENFKASFYNDYYQKQWSVEQVAIDTQRKKAVGFRTDTDLLDKKLNINVGGDLWGEDQLTAPSFTSFWADQNWDINWFQDSASSVPAQVSKMPYRNIYGQAKFNLLDNFGILAGGRADYQQSAETQHTIYSERGGLFFDVSQDLSVKYLYNNAPRRPQANEAGQGVNSEKLGAHGLIASYNIHEKARADVTLFTQKLDNQISRKSSSFNTFTNAGGLKSNGVEWGLKYMPLKDALVYWNGSFQSVKVERGYYNGVETLASISSRDPSNRALFVPEFTSFLGVEVPVTRFARVNADWRSIGTIPYQNLDGTFSTRNGNFGDVTIRSKELWNNHVSLRVAALNVTNSGYKLPAYGEHVGNHAGLLPPEGRRFTFTTTYKF